MEKTNLNKEVSSNGNIIIKETLSSKVGSLIFSASNVNAIIFGFWLAIYYLLYYGYTINRLNKTDENSTSGVNVDLLKIYNSKMNRILPFLIFIIVLVVLQYVINIFIMRDKCGSDKYISFRTLNIYTIGGWFVILLTSFMFLLFFPKFKGIYSNTIIHEIFNKMVQPSPETIYGDLFKNVNEIENDELNLLVKKINCVFKINKTGEEDYCAKEITKGPLLFLNNINISNSLEYLKLMDPITNKNGGENNFKKYLIKKDILSEMIWIFKIGLLVIIFIYTKLKNDPCLNQANKFEENVNEYIKSKIKRCSVEESEEKDETP